MAQENLQAAHEKLGACTLLVFLGKDEPEEAEGGHHEHGEGEFEKVGIPADEDFWPGEGAAVGDSEDIGKGSSIEQTHDAGDCQSEKEHEADRVEADFEEVGAVDQADVSGGGAERTIEADLGGLVAEDFDKGKKHDSSGNENDDGLGDAENAPSEAAGFVEIEAIVDTAASQKRTRTIATAHAHATNFCTRETASGLSIVKPNEKSRHIIRPPTTRGIEIGELSLSSRRIDIEIDERRATTRGAHAKEAENHVERIERGAGTVISATDVSTREEAGDVEGLLGFAAVIAESRTESLRKFVADEGGLPGEGHFLEVTFAEEWSDTVGAGGDSDRVVREMAKIYRDKTRERVRREDESKIRALTEDFPAIALDGGNGIGDEAGRADILESARLIGDRLLMATPLVEDVSHGADVVRFPVSLIGSAQNRLLGALHGENNPRE